MRCSLDGIRPGCGPKRPSSSPIFALFPNDELTTAAQCGRHRCSSKSELGDAHLGRLLSDAPHCRPMFTHQLDPSAEIPPDVASRPAEPRGAGRSAWTASSSPSAMRTCWCWRVRTPRDGPSSGRTLGIPGGLRYMTVGGLWGVCSGGPRGGRARAAAALAYRAVFGCSGAGP